MLLEFKCSNYKSIKDEVLFSMIASSDGTMCEKLCDYSNHKVLRTAAIYGPNGSGKSNFIEALTFMRNTVYQSIFYQPDVKVGQRSHKLSSAGAPSTYDIQFTEKGARYAYGFTVERDLIKDEYLYCFPNGRRTVVFERDGLDVRAGDKYKKDFGVSQSVLKENRLFLSCAVNYSRVPEILDAFNFFAKDLIIYSQAYNLQINNWLAASVKMMQDDEGLKNKFVEFLQELGTGVKDVIVKSEKVKFKDVPQVPDFFSESVRELLSKNEGDRIEAKVVYDQFDVDINEESMGTKCLFQTLCPIIDVLDNDKILVCDEIENGLHESIVDYIIRMFQDQPKERTAQLIFSTHDINLLESDLFRRDQIWFTQLKEDRSTDLYSLLEIRDVRKSEKIAWQYMKGRYGAVPAIKMAQ